VTRAALVSIILLAAAPAAAQATTFTSGDIALGDDALHVRFTADGPIGEARVSTEPGAVRIRFAEATGDVRLDLPGDGDVLRFVRVRPGAEDATVAVLRFTDRRELDPSSVLVRSTGGEVDISIDRSLLPATSATAPIVETAPAPAPEPMVGAPAPELLALNTTEPAPARPALFAPPAPLLADHAPADAAPADAPLGVRGDETASGRTSLLILLAVVAAAALGVVHWLRGRKGQVQARLPIAVVASHRISQRQQLVVVRALGQDHLLSIDGNRTERLCSQPSPGLQAAGLVAEAPSSEPTGDFGAHLAEMLGQLPKEAPVQRTGMATGPLSIRDAAPAMREVATLPGSGLLNPAIAGYAATPMMNHGPAATDAVAGLLRLRARTFR
jgi:hypothetical protein